VEPARELKMPVANSTGILEHPQQLTVLQHKSPRSLIHWYGISGQRYLVSSLAVASCVVNQCSGLLDSQIRASGSARLIYRQSTVLSD
jgi:hypothetical protein